MLTFSFLDPEHVTCFLDPEHVRGCKAQRPTLYMTQSCEAADDIDL